MKRRRFKKERKIKVIPDGNTVEFDFEKIKEVAERMGIKAYLKGSDNIVEFESKYGSWIATITEGNYREFIKLYHDTKDGNRHLQNTYFDYKFLCRSTRDHDYWKTKRKGGNSVDYVFYKYNNGMIPRFKVN